jgi:hypothetical protein
MAAKAKGVGANAKSAMKTSGKTTPVTPPLAGWMGAKKAGKNPGVGSKGAMGKPTVRKGK